MSVKINFKAFLLIIGGALILAFIYNYFSIDGISFLREPLIVSNVNELVLDDSSKVLKGLNLEHVIELQNQKVAIFIDARDQWDYSDGHIVGALNIPEFSFDPDNKTLSSIKKESLIIVYCDGDDCDTSKRLTNQLTKLGYTNSYVFLGGYKEWIEAELPIESGKN
jgi:rhodanese-related sulfurtransferase